MVFYKEKLQSLILGELLTNNVLRLSALVKKVIRKLEIAITNPINRYLTIPYFIIPDLKKNFGLTGYISTIKAHGSYIVIGDGYAYKVGLRKLNHIKFEFNQRNAVLKIWPNLKDIFAELEYFHGGFYSFLRIPLYRKISLNDSYFFAIEIYQIFKNYQTTFNRHKLLQNLNFINEGFKIIQNHASEKQYEIIKSNVQNFILSGEFTVGAAHGDLHSRNIMLDKEGNIKLIDFDCLRKNSIQEFDALNFILEFIWSKTNTQWFETVIGVLSMLHFDHFVDLSEKFGLKRANFICILYFLDRIGQEKINHGIEYSPDILSRYIQAVVLLK